MALTDSFDILINDLINQARHSRQRRALVLSGSHTWCLDQVRAVIAHFDEAHWISDTSGPGHTTHFKPNQTRQLLGTESNAVVIDAHRGFNPNALGAASGIIRAGGLLILLCPSLEHWHKHNDPEYSAILSYGCESNAIQGHFLARMARLIKTSRHTTTVEEGLPLPSLDISVTITADQLFDDDICRTDDQHKAVEAIVRVATGHRRRPLVITADRGRGKSASLGIAAAQLLQQGTGPLVVTAPQPDAVKSLFAQAARLLPDAEIRKNQILYNGISLHFVAPDELTQHHHDAALVMVDEAAAIPAPLLSKLLQQHARIVFSSTIHGYEGSGRGFAIRFKETLDRITPKWRHLILETPIRWANGDPVEALTFALLKLDASPASDAAIVDSVNEQYRIVKLSQAELVTDETLLNELFGLLVTAHYQTTPRDLQMLMDSPDLSIYVFYRGAHIAGTVLSVTEGGFSKPLAQAIWLGERRLRGHLIPQSLANHAGIATAAELTGERIMRIAIHPALRHQGLGKRLLEAVIEDSKQNNRDFIASSFGATPELLNFWQASRLTPLRLGSTRDTASGEHSALVMLPLSEAASRLHKLARKRFAQQLPLLMSDSLRSIESSLAVALLRETSKMSEIGCDVLTDQDWLDCLSFACSNRTYDGCVLAIEKMLLKALRDNQAHIAPELLNVLVRKVLQKYSWQEVALHCQLSGEKAAVTQLRLAVGQIIQQYLPECPAPVHAKLQPLLDRL